MKSNAMTMQPPRDRRPGGHCCSPGSSVVIIGVLLIVSPKVTATGLSWSWAASASSVG